MSAKCRILVVDDDIATSILTCKRLEQAGFEVSCALSADDALLLLETRDVDALIVDYQLATQNGIDFFRTAVAQGIVVPAVMVTGIEDPDLEQFAFDCGMQEFVAKSLDYLDTLPSVVRDVVDGRINRATRTPRANHWECTTALFD